jgi:hypothetical protein
MLIRFRQAGKPDAFLCRRYSHNRSAITEPPGMTSSIAAYGARTRSFAMASVDNALHVRCVVRVCAPRGESKVVWDPVTNIIKLSLSLRAQPNDEWGSRKSTSAPATPANSIERMPLRQLKDENRSDRGGNRQHPLRHSRKEIYLVGHVHFSVD